MRLYFYCCSRPFSEDDEQRKKVRDHCHITGKYRGAACNRCNKDYLNIIANSHPIPIVFHNLTGYDMHHVMRSLGGRGVQIMATTSERIITANITSEESTHGIKYIDSLNFMSMVAHDCHSIFFKFSMFLFHFVLF